MLTYIFAIILEADLKIFLILDTKISKKKFLGTVQKIEKSKFVPNFQVL